jgi:phosphoribosyl-ATP pyrophosphohydrolase
MSENSMKNIDYLEKLTETIKNNAFKDAEFSYTARLIGDIEHLSKKIGEEASEVIIAALSKDKENLKKEAADLIYHLMVLLEQGNLSIDDVCGELMRRKGVSGHEEKKSRK